MFERGIATYDRNNFRKRLSEFLDVANKYMQDDINEHNIFIKFYTEQNYLEMRYINV